MLYCLNTLNKQGYLNLNHYEAIVIGSGATGGIAALTLAEKGLNVLIIEAGPKIKREEASVNEPRDTFNRIIGVMSKKHLKQSQHPGYWKNNPSLYANELNHSYTNPENKPFIWTQGKHYGGKSLTWGGITLRFSPQDFKPADQDNYGPNWPICYEDLRPHYDYIEELLGVYGNKDNLEQVPDGKYVGKIPLTNEELNFGKVIQKKLNYPFIQSRGLDKNSAAKTKNWPKSSSIGSTIKKALETGRVHILDNHMVESFETSKETQLAKKVKIINLKNGKKKELDCELLFLCASTISTLRILLNSEDKTHSSGFKDLSGKLGKCLMDHISICRFFSVEQISTHEESMIKSSSLSGAGSFFMPFGSKLTDNKNINFLRGYGIWGAINRLGVPKCIQKDPSKAIGFLIAHGEVLPRESNKVKLSNQVDKWGLRIPHIEFEWSENELNMTKHMEQTIIKSVAAVNGEIKNFKDLFNIPFLGTLEKNSIALSNTPPPPGYYIHEVGGAPMGNSRTESVLDKWNRLWCCKNVFVLDGSCWPTSSWQSPTLTMMAVSRRVCLNIKQILKE